MRKGMIALIFLIILGLLYIINAVNYKGYTLSINFIPQFNNISFTNIFFDMFLLIVVIISYVYFIYRDDI